jgi:CRP-like cAMP-binding protein
MTRIGNSWRARLARYARFGREEQSALDESIAASRHFATHDDLVKAGDPLDRLFVVVDGYACQYRLLADGRRQILSYLFAGDMTDPRQLLLGEADLSLCVLWPSVVATLPLESTQRLERMPAIALAMARYAHTQYGIAREWLVNLGQRTAFERLSHLLCEIHTRMDIVGFTRDHSFDLPLTQAELGDTLALSAVHVNRTLMELRRLGMVTFQNRQVRIHDYGRLRAAAGFDPAYLKRGEVVDGAGICAA